MKARRPGNRTESPSRPSFREQTLRSEPHAHCSRCRRNPGRNSRLGAVTVEYLLLVTLVGIGVIVGLSTVRNAMVSELTDIATAIEQIVVP